MEIITQLFPLLLVQVIGIVTRKDLARYRTWAHRGQMGTEELTVLQHSQENEQT